MVVAARRIIGTFQMKLTAVTVIQKDSLLLYETSLFDKKKSLYPVYVVAFYRN